MPWQPPASMPAELAEGDSASSSLSFPSSRHKTTARSNLCNAPAPSITFFKGCKKAMHSPGLSRWRRQGKYQVQSDTTGTISSRVSSAKLSHQNSWKLYIYPGGSSGGKLQALCHVPSNKLATNITSYHSQRGSVGCLSQPAALQKCLFSLHPSRDAAWIRTLLCSALPQAVLCTTLAMGVPSGRGASHPMGNGEEEVRDF